MSRSSARYKVAPIYPPLLYYEVMKTKVENISETKVKLTITVDATALADAEKVALVKLSKDVKVDGFRKGKVPANVAAKHVNPQVLQEQLLDDAISKAVAESFMAEKIQALDRPMVEVKKYVPGESLEFTAEVDILPKVTLGDYAKLDAKTEKVEVKDADVEEVIGRIQQGFAEKKTVTRKAQEGDETVIDFVGKKDDVAFDGGTGTDYTLKLGANQFIPGFEEGIVGHKAGEAFDLNLEFPEDYHAKDLAGEKVVFSVTLKEVKEPQLPEINDDLAKKAGDYKTLQELKDEIKGEITQQKEREASDKLKDSLVNQLIEKSEVPVPEVLVADQMRSIEQDFAQNLMYQGMSLEQYVETSTFKDVEDWRENEVKPSAEMRVKAGLVLSELSQAENITADDAEIDAHVALYKQQYGNNPEALKQFDTPEVRRDIANRYVTEKTVDRLVELNTKK